jgi:PIN domain
MRFMCNGLLPVSSITQCWPPGRQPPDPEMDAYLAALAIEHGCEVITADRDFRGFPGLRWRHPLN